MIMTDTYIYLFNRSEYDDRHVEGKCHQCFTYDSYWWMDQLGILWISYEYVIRKGNIVLMVLC